MKLALLRAAGPALAAAVLALAAVPARADIKIGVTVSVTGAAASIGLPQKNAIALLPQTLAGQKLRYIVLDDATDPTKAVSNTRRLVSEEQVDVVIGSTVTPNALAMLDVVSEARVPMIALAAASKIVEPVDAKRRWAFKTPQNDSMMSLAIAAHMKAHGVRTVGFIGFADAYGESWATEFAKAAALDKLAIVASERYARSDSSVTAQVLKLQAAHPDAILVGASGTPAALPQITLKERGYAGLIYQTHGVTNADFLRVGGRNVEGTFLPAGPVLVAAQLPAGHPVRASALAYVAAYDAAYGAGSASPFGANAWDAGQLLSAALPVALGKAAPGTPEFRAALRDALENVKDVAGAQGVFTMSPADHLGLDQRARVMVKIEHGAWKLQE